VTALVAAVVAMLAGCAVIGAVWMLAEGRR